MAWQYMNNLYIRGVDVDGGKWAYDFIQFLVASGSFEVLGSGDGRTAFENSGQTGGAGTGTAGVYDVMSATPPVGGVNWVSNIDNDWSNTESWYRFRQVGTNLEWVVHRHNNANQNNQNQFRILFSRSGFTNADADANNHPTGSEMEIIRGGLSTWGAIGPINEECVVHAAVQDVADDGHYPFAVWMVTYEFVSDVGAWMFDVLSDVQTGDAENYIHGSNNVNIQVSDQAQSYHDHGGAQEQWTDYEMCGLYGNINWMFPRGVPTQADGNSRSFPVIYAVGSTGRYKGIGKNFLFKGHNNRGRGDVADLATANARYYHGDMLFPWQQNVVPLA